MEPISTKPVSGMRDFLPLEARRRREVFHLIEQIFQRYGFDPLDTPCMERLSTLLGKYGEEGDQLIFKVMKRGNKLDQAISNHPNELSLADTGLRYDLTVPLARIYAQYPNDFPRIFKRYQIAPVWRADRPQKGRYREFVQCDVDIVGTSSFIAEVEVITALSDILQQLNFTDFTIHINHRDLLYGLITCVGIPDEKAIATITTLDKLDKIGVDGVEKELKELQLQEGAPDSLLKILTKEVVARNNNEAMLHHLKSSMASDEKAQQAIDTLSKIITLVERTPASGHLAIDPFLARGLSYYTGPIFEIRSNDFSGSIGGGGRYDKLIGMFRGGDVPAVGFSLGIERILMLLEERNEKEMQLSGADVLITLWDESYAAYSLALATKLRHTGLRTDIYCSVDKFGKQFSYANDRRIPYTIILAPAEVEAGVIKVKDMESGEEFTFTEEKAVDWLCERC